MKRHFNHRDTEDTEVAQRRRLLILAGNFNWPAKYLATPIGLSSFLLKM
jgi:hypothetical protein